MSSVEIFKQMVRTVSYDTVHNMEQVSQDLFLQSFIMIIVVLFVIFRCSITNLHYLEKQYDRTNICV